jgi:hypothetical protein
VKLAVFPESLLRCMSPEDRKALGQMKLNLGPGYVPEFIRNGFCMRLPTAGEGVHKFLFRLARMLHPWRTEASIRNALHQFARGCGRYVSEREITAAIEDSRAHAWTPKGPLPLPFDSMSAV